MVDKITNKEKEFFKLIKNLGKEDKLLLTQAFAFAKKVHEGQKRQSKDDYFLHPLIVAINLQKRFGDSTLTAAALLHDTAEDCPEVTLKVIYKKFGKKVGFLVDAVTKTTLKYYKNKTKFKSKIGKLLWGGLRDVRALILKIADREHNLTDLDILVPNKQIKISFETQAIYYPLRKILNYNQAKNLAEIQSRFNEFIFEKKIGDQHKFREELSSNYFSGLNRDLYDIVYDNSDKIIWVVDDKIFFENMCRSKDFNRAVDNLKMWTDGKKFRATFSFKKGMVIRNFDIKYDILKYKA